MVTTIISYSDGEGSGGVGVAVFNHPDHSRPQAGYLLIPQVFRDLWRNIEKKIQGASSYEDIFQLEAVGPLMILETWPETLNTCCWIHWIDNAAAQASLISGSSSVYSGDLIAGETWRIISQRRIYPWFERVESKSNPVDGLSRGERPASWDIVKLAFPRGLKRACKAFMKDNNLENQVDHYESQPFEEDPDPGIGGTMEGALVHRAMCQAVGYDQNRSRS